LKLSAKDNRLSKGAGCLNTFCSFPNGNKRLLSQSDCSVSRPKRGGAETNTIDNYANNTPN